MCEHHHEEKSKWWQPLLSGLLLVAGMVIHYIGLSWFASPWVQLLWYIVAFLPVGLGVMHEAIEHALHGQVFSEFMLMSVACVGAFAIGEYPEAVAVMLLYCIGEALQDLAVDKARHNIASLTNYRPEYVRLQRWNGEKNVMQQVLVAPEEVNVGDVIEVLPGERVALDGELLLPDDQRDAFLSFDTAALTGESLPRQMRHAGEVLAGMIALERTATLRVTRPQSESTLTRILKMVEEASAKPQPSSSSAVLRAFTPLLLFFLLFSPWFCHGFMLSSHPRMNIISPHGCIARWCFWLSLAPVHWLLVCP